MDHAARKHGISQTFGDAAPSYDTIVPFFTTFGRALVAAAGIEAGDRVLDIASGRGACTWPALEATGPTGSVLALDLAPPMVAALADDLAAAGLAPPQAEARLGDLEALDVPDASVDVVVCGFGIFLAPRISVALTEVHRVLRPGGRFAASTFVGGLGGFAWFGEIVGAVAPGTPAPSGTNLITADGLRGPLAAAGFAPPRVEAVSGRFAIPDIDALVAWYRSHGGRATMEALDDAQLAAFRILAAERLAADDHELDQHAELTVASRP